MYILYLYIIHYTLYIIHYTYILYLYIILIYYTYILYLIILVIAAEHYYISYCGRTLLVVLSTGCIAVSNLSNMLYNCSVDSAFMSSCSLLSIFLLILT